MHYKPRWVLPSENLLASSQGRSWHGIGAELRRHSPGELPEMVADSTVIGLALRGNKEAVIHRRGNGLRQATPAATGTVWLCPQGVQEEAIRITAAIPEMLHIYLPANPFAALAQEDGLPAVNAQAIRYDTDFADRLVAGLASCVVAELMAETSSGRLLVETTALTLAAWLLHAHSCIRLPDGVRTRSPRPLDSTRLRRVLEFIEASFRDDISVDDLATVACLSPFHFSRAFKAATGKTPHRLVADRRLRQAKELLERGVLSLADIALMSNFSSQASFTRAFTRAVGLTPGAFRRRAR